MHPNTHCIIGVHITDRLNNAVDVQTILTKYGRNIKTRLGLHDVEEPPSTNGIILLEMAGDSAAWDALKQELAQIEGVETKEMTFDH